MATPAADWCNIGVGAGKSNYQIDYSTATGAGITTATPSTLASSTGISNILYADASNSHMMLRSDVDVDVIASNGYPRSEFRERQQDGTTLRAFNPTTGDHWVECWIFPTHLPPNFKPSFVMIQMHDASDDLIEIAWQPATSFATDGKQEIVLRINGTSSGVPKFVTDAKLNTWYRCRIHVGAIISGAAGYECSVNAVTMRSSDSGMPALVASGANSYFKCGMYLQTKWTGSGTLGLETDRNEYGEAGYRDFRTSHNGETATSVQVRGTNTLDAISNVRWGTKVEAVNTTGVLFTFSPALPASLVVGDMLYAIVRARRSSGASAVSTPALDATTPGWVRIINYVSTAATSGTNLVSHCQRYEIWCKPWASGLVAPVFDYTASTTTDIVSAQMVALAGAKISQSLTEVGDQVPTDTNYSASSSTTVIGPTAALPANARAGALALALISHEFNVTSGTVSTTSGDSLTWAAGGIGVGTTVAFQAWANDWAIVPATAGQSIAAKQCAGTLTTGKSASLLLTLAPARKHRRWLRAAS
jgi:hypothetical protein